jgi:hypothetical protein
VSSFHGTIVSPGDIACIVKSKCGNRKYCTIGSRSVQGFYDPIGDAGTFDRATRCSLSSIVVAGDYQIMGEYPS